MRESRAICQRRTPRTRAVARFRSACERPARRRPWRRSSLWSLVVAMRSRTAKAATREGLMRAGAGAGVGGFAGILLKKFTLLQLKASHEVHAVKLLFPLQLNFFKNQRGPFCRSCNQFPS